MKPLSQEWIEKAEGDYKVVEDEWETSDPVRDAVCFHAQQCVEKYLKAWLTEKGMPFPRTHDLEALAKLARASLLGVARSMKDLIFLTSSAVEVRYPGTFVGDKESERYRRIMLKRRQLISRKLELKGR